MAYNQAIHSPIPCRRKPVKRAGNGAIAGHSPAELRFRLDPLGRQHFNFPQRIWLRPAVPMACTRTRSTALLTLAANLLSLSLPRQATGQSQPAERLAVALARRFSEECLLGAPAVGWVMPREAISAWVQSKVRGNRRLAGRRVPSATRRQTRAGTLRHAYRR
jgi:hypothetical protein